MVAVESPKVWAVSRKGMRAWRQPLAHDVFDRLFAPLSRHSGIFMDAYLASSSGDQEMCKLQFPADSRANILLKHYT